jgi:hypothetical protein
MNNHGIRGLENWDAVQKYHDDKIAERDAEIERMKVVLKNRFEDRKMDLQTIRIQKQLIADLVDELDFWEQSEGFLWGEPELKKRARESAK